MTPPILAKKNLFNFLAKRVDFGKKFLGNDIFGSHKTWRGVIFGLLVGILFSFFQKFLYQFSFFQKISLIDYSKINILLFGFLISGGAIFGDLVFAFIKRRLKLAPGAIFFPFDQINYIIGASIFLTPVFEIKIEVWILLLILTPILHVITTHLGFYLNLTKSKW
jgi:CDP-2,3-bis-(O-geranylgeranyl)-sn-glycerol synthase